MRAIIESFSRIDIALMRDAVARLAGKAPQAPGTGPDDVTIELRVAGGAPRERVEFHTTISSRSTAEVSHVDKMRGFSDRFAATVRPDELAAMGRDMNIDGLLNLQPNTDERYVPDSLVGSVAITAGNGRITLMFQMQDEAPAANEEVAMRLEPGKGNLFVLRAALVPQAARPALGRLAAVVNRLAVR